MRKTLFLALVAVAGVSNAQLAISIGIRETNTSAAIGSNGGTSLSQGGSAGIEWVNLDGQNLNIDGTWQTFTFNFQADALTAFAGGTADGAYTGTRGTLESIRITNTNGAQGPMSLWVDDVTNTTAAGSVNFGDFESFAAGDVAMFQAPGFSGSTNGIAAGSTAQVDDTVSASGSNSYRGDFEFESNGYIRWTTFNTANLPNPAIDFSDGSSLTFQMRAVPEPATMTLLGLGLAGLALKKRKRK